jgi:hypothetical protein
MPFLGKDIAQRRQFASAAAFQITGIAFWRDVLVPRTLGSALRT